MAIIMFDEKRFKLNVRLKVGESFTPNSKLEVLNKEAEQLRNDYVLFSKRLQSFLHRCKDWNAENDEDFAKTLNESKQRMEKIKPPLSNQEVKKNN